ncbi:Calcium-activated potassium channel slowpoke (dSlo) (BK channel) (Maxi K channel) (MaxiK) [Durusdinium trenchii]|uniref:Calcium-activated potassium channel slowpoke (DSlo) (BK channel) (Maxi K channel) (MaxiK) n=1 Tax=Durusdinium trenchii TaxID=1381693 RepID=A0ABP0R105_9DINO
MDILEEDVVVNTTTTPVDTRAKDAFTTVTKKHVITQASWEEAQAQLILFLSLWGGLFVVTLLLGISRRLWSPESMNRKLSQQLAVLKSSVYWNIFMFILMIFLVVLYVLRSEGMTLDENLTFVELTAAAFYSIEAFITWLHFSSAGVDGILAFFFNYVFVACLVIPSVLYRSLSGQTSHFSFAFCASVRASQIWCDWVMFHRRGRMKFTDHLTMYAATFLSGTFSIGMFIREMETLDGVDPNFLNGSEPPTGENATAVERWSVYASLYLMFVNTCKTGFGDLHPRNPVAQVLSVVGTGACAYLVIGVLMKVLQNNETGGLSRPRYPNRSGFRHIVITGTPSLQVLVDFLHEFFHKDNQDSTEDLDVVILYVEGQRNVMQQLAQRLSVGGSDDLRILQKVWMVEGSALKPEDLNRVRFQACSAAFLLPNMYASDPEREDVSNIMRALTMKRHTSYVHLLCMVMKAHSVEGLMSVGVPPQDVICFDDVIQGILGKAAEVQGYLTLAASLLKTSKMLSNAEITKKGHSWAEDYASSLAMTIFEVDLASSYKTVPFCEVAADICDRSGFRAYLIGLAEEALFPADKTEYVLFPNKYYRVGLQQDRDVKGIVMAKKREDIRQALPGRAIKWSPESWATGSGQVQANPRLSTMKASTDKEGWVRDHFTEQSDKQAYLHEKLDAAAKRRAALGLVHRGKLSRVEVENYLDESNDDFFDTRDELEDIMEDPTSEVMQDPFERALLERRMEAKQQILDEKDQMDAEAADDILYGENESIRMALVQINHFEEVLYRKRMPDPIVQREDEMLWGAPVPPAETVWANAKEPPDELLVRGDHVILMSLESDLPEDEADVEEDSLATGKRKPLRPGRMLSLKTFLRSMRCQKKRRPLVVVSERVPYDWGRVANEPFVFLVLGVPYSPSTLERAGFLQAKSIVIYQKDVSRCTDAPLIDSQAVFAQRLMESLLRDSGAVRTPVILHLHMEDNTELLTESAEAKKSKGLLEMLESKTREDDDDEGGQPKRVEVEEMQQIILQHRFASSVLFSSNLVTCLMANVMFQPSLAAVISEMSKAAFVVVEVPEVWKGLTFGQLFIYMMRKRNLMPMALLRKTNAQEALDFLDSSVENRRVEDPEEKLEVIYAQVSRKMDDWRAQLTDDAEKQRYIPGDPSFKRYTLVMPLGPSYVVYNDGVICMQSTTRTTLPRTGGKRERFDDPIAHGQSANEAVR